MHDVKADLPPSRVSKDLHPFDVALGARIHALRVAAGMTLVTLGEAAGVSFQQVQKYEAGRDNISASMVFLLATALNVPVASFFGGVPLHAPTEAAAGDTLSMEILVLFEQIHDDRVRKQLLALTEALARDQARCASEVAEPVRRTEQT